MKLRKMAENHQIDKCFESLITSIQNQNKLNKHQNFAPFLFNLLINKFFPFLLAFFIIFIRKNLRQWSYDKMLMKELGRAGREDICSRSWCTNRAQQDPYTKTFSLKKID